MVKNIFWDMDGTLGFFEQIYYWMNNLQPPEYMLKSINIREGIEGLLEELNNKGFHQYVTTSAAEDYATEVMNRTNLNKYFKKIYAREQISGIYSNPKKYDKVITENNITNASSDVLIIGNSLSDIPRPHNNIVSIIDLNSWVHNSELAKNIIDLLMKNGDGDFNKGFFKLYETAEKENYYAHLKPYGIMTIQKNAQIALHFAQYRDCDYNDAPVIRVIKANEYYSKNIKLD